MHAHDFLQKKKNAQFKFRFRKCFKKNPQMSSLMFHKMLCLNVINLTFTWGIHDRIVRVVDLESFAPHRCGFESCPVIKMRI